MYDIVFCSKHDKNNPAYENFRAAYPNAKYLPNVASITQAIAASTRMCMTSMHWLITDDVDINQDLDLSWKTETWDRPYVHVWPTVDHLGNTINEFAGVYLVPNRYKLTEEEISTGVLSKIKPMSGPVHTLRAYDVIHASYHDHIDIAHAALSLGTQAVTEMHWIVMDDVILDAEFDINWRPPTWDRNYVHVWKTSAGTHTGIYLVPGYYAPDSEELQQGSLKSIKFMDAIASRTVPHDIFFISYQEPYAQENFNRLQARFPRAQHVSGIKGIHKAHLRCAELSSTPMFWTVDADTIADNSFGFDYHPPDYDKQYLHLWHSRNPVNGLEYGWGAIKLWPTRLVREFKSNWLDFTTTVGNIKIIPDVVATTKYNCDELGSWRSGFREAVKLCVNVQNGDHLESMERLMVWCTVDNGAEYAEASMQGARAGIAYYLDWRESFSAGSLKNINDFDWLMEMFNNRERHLEPPTRSNLLSALRG